LFTNSKIFDGRKIEPYLDKPTLIYRSTKHAILIGIPRYFSNFSDKTSKIYFGLWIRFDAFFQKTKYFYFVFIIAELQ
jgi:hypothetical protein